MKETKRAGLYLLAAVGTISTIALNNAMYNHVNHKFTSSSLVSAEIVKPIGITDYAEYNVDHMKNIETLIIHSGNPFIGKKVCKDYDKDNKVDLIQTYGVLSNADKITDISVRETPHNKKLFDNANKILALFK